MDEPDLRVERLAQLPLTELQPLVEESLGEGFFMLQKLVEQYKDGSNRFDRPGEVLSGVYAGATLIAVGGLNRDPYQPDGVTGRIRRVYVRRDWRRGGVGRRLVERLIAAAQPAFYRLTLRTHTQEAARFYEALGFQKQPAVKGATHHMNLRNA